MYGGADKSLGLPWKETSYSDQDLQHSTKTYGVQTAAVCCCCLYAVSLGKGKVRAVPLQAWSSLEGSRKLRFPDFMTTAQDGEKVVSFTPRKCSWYSFLLEAESTPGP